MKVAALGYYGFANLGDEAVLAGIRRALAAEPVFAGATLTVLTADPALTQRLHPGVVCAPRWSFASAWEALKGTDLFVLGGGSLLQDVTSARSVLWYALMATLARRRARRVLWWGQGIGPLRTPLARRTVAALAARADGLTVRDPASAALLKEIGVRRSISVVADPAFALDPEPGRSAARQGTLVAMRPWAGRTACEALSDLPPDLPGPVRALPMHLPDDLCTASATPALDWSAEGAAAPIERALGAVASAELVVAMRLHALIFAARCATPFVALAYDPKVAALASSAGQDDVLVATDGLTPARLAAAIDRVRATSAERRERLYAFAAAQQAAARIPAQHAAEWFA